jgi:anti-sigma factor RsiW
MSEHEDLRADLSLHALGDLDPAGAERLAAHLERCEPCRRELAELRATLGELRSIDEPHRALPAALAALPVLPELAAARPRRSLLRAAALLAIFAGGLIAGRALTESSPSPKSGSLVGGEPPPWCDDSTVQRNYGLGQALLALKAARGGEE